MNKVRIFLWKYASAICIAVSLALFFLSLIINTSAGDSAHTARKVERKIEKRMELLDDYIDKAMNSNRSTLLDLDLPEDMVIYRYVYDTLQSWCNQFPISNDDISSRLIIQRLTGLRVSVNSPLRNVTDQVRYMNIGSRWYLTKSASNDFSCKVIAGLEIKNHLLEHLHRTDNGVNSRLSLPERFTIEPIDESGGYPVCFKDTPLFKIISETRADSSPMSNSIMRWIALALMVLASMMFLVTHRTVNVFIANTVVITAAAVIAFIWGRHTQSAFFSPTVYAGGQFLYSFGAMMVMNLTVIMLIQSIYIIREKLFGWMETSRPRHRAVIYLSSIGVLILSVIFYTGMTLRSLVMNSGIQLELYLWNHLSGYTLIVYLTYMALLFCLLLLIQMLSPAVKVLTGRGFNVFSKTALLVYSLLSATYFTVMLSTMGFKKEQDRMIVLSNRLAVDRDLGLELNLRSVEDAIAADPFISALSHLERGNRMILNRLSENYLSNITQDYDIVVAVCPSDSPGCLRRFEQRIFGGTPIAGHSHFFYTYDTSGQSSYIGVFPFYSQEHGLSRIVIDIEPKTNREDRGYYSILGRYTKPGGVSIPPFYSYAKYINGKLVSYKGAYAYPTIAYERFAERINSGVPYVRANGYIHFVNRVNDNESIIISRKVRGAMTYMVTFSYLSLIMFFSLYLLVYRRVQDEKKEEDFRSNYFRSRINAVLLFSLIASLVVMSGVSVAFVYKRNQTNLHNTLSGKITTIQTMLDSQCKSLSSPSDLTTNSFANIIEIISDDTKSDITIYSPTGKALRSTTPEIFDRMVMGSRINEEAYYYIKYMSQRFYILQDRFGKNVFYSLYAPIINDKGTMLGIVSVPYTGQDLDFKQDALFHAATIINIFIILILLTVLVGRAFINNMFKPLIELGKKMNETSLHGLEYIMYRRHDEVSTLVDAYNRMVHDLSISSKKLAQAERDKAWSEMARQVAHEIKNPLTPIKLELQSLIKAKQKNDPAWSEKFDRVSAVVLEHIDILTHTANEFSTFAKLYSEEPVEMDLDATLRDQLIIFDNQENIEISYIGLEGARIMGPKPQIIRVFVNLITNAVQAVESMQKEAEEKSLEPIKGRIFISLRNGVKDGYYDIVFEDNGPGVKDENQEKLFTPNFTTKTGGTGLGLAICRNIVEKCEGEIFYRKSYSLGGACFVVSLPRKA